MLRPDRRDERPSKSSKKQSYKRATSDNLFDIGRDTKNLTGEKRSSTKTRRHQENFV